MTTAVPLTNAVNCLLVCLPDAILGVGNQQWTGKVPILGIFVFLCFFFSGIVSRSGIAVEYSSSTFSFLSKLHTVFHNGCTSYYSHQQVY